MTYSPTRQSRRGKNAFASEGIIDISVPGETGANAGLDFVIAASTTEYINDFQFGEISTT